LLLLDEPTNFLDLRTQILLEHFLRNFNEACLIVSHDRSFLGATCTETLDLAAGKLTLFPGKIDHYLEYQRERREHDERANAAIQAKQRELQKFIDKNKARASTANRAKSKSKQLERLQLNEVAGDEPTAHIRAPQVEPRQGPAVRCQNLAIGYPDHRVASGIDLEIEHGERAGIVGDNGQGKTTLLRTLVDSLTPLGGHVRWGYGCDLGVYAQHVYRSLPEGQTIAEYLEYQALPGTTTQQILAQAGALLFRGGDVKKRISVLSGGERARLCLAGLLLGSYNVLILDEPGNHLDVETVEALADALLDYKGTVLFTSHDRHFMKRVATSVVEVREGQVRNYAGGYDAYLYSVNKEIDDGERELAAQRAKAKIPPGKAPKPVDRSAQRDERKVRKAITNIERTIARLDQQKSELNSHLLETTDPEEALALHNELTALTAELTEAEERWCELQGELEEVDWTA
jgi:ATP-binding cassette, subfamily F, member 3